IRMLQNGAKGYNIKEGLLSMRAGSDMYRRRSGSKYAASQRKLFAYMKESGFISAADYVSSCCIRTASSMAPNMLREGLFKKMLRK
ncbi:MAG: amylovoran biosynthesis protein AmsE, partial [Lachnospiraceae bacterium]|nr:amylovoran biosynthesis protein AmsE [Candidatus Equihabitans merdae]